MCWYKEDVFAVIFRVCRTWRALRGNDLKMRLLLRILKYLRGRLVDSFKCSLVILIERYHQKGLL